MGTNSGGDLLLRLDRGATAAVAGPARGGAAGGDPRRASGRRLAAAPDPLAGRGPRRLAAAGGGLLRPAAGRGLPDLAGRSRDLRRRGGPQRRRRARRRARRTPCATTSSPATPTSPASRGAPGCGPSGRFCARLPTAPRLPRSARGAGAAAGPRRAPAPRPRGRRRRAGPCSSVGGAAQAIALLAGVLGAGLEVAVEDPGLPLHREILTAAGRTSLTALPLDEDGAHVEALERVFPAAVLVTPAHQSPTGTALSAAQAGGPAGVGPLARGARDRGRLRRRVPLRPPAARGAAGARPGPRGVHGDGQQDAGARLFGWAGWCCPSGWWTPSPSTSAWPTPARRRSSNSPWPS